MDNIETGSGLLSGKEAQKSKMKNKKGRKKFKNSSAQHYVSGNSTKKLFAAMHGACHKPAHI
ncbi:hypothetical protein EFA69_13955 [Rufibacter immobilis]|uniref:Uncharacterized protein n=1 Tax=Rufibacter immobilis TaxID=1348778 RepID=A0A3M9MP10_9BACT|nr:hypothetical protein [Rufibacter immobilis]RNI27256.1 hypothetical protein EFA69_13955 [Rufibacter immobilis]